MDSNNIVETNEKSKFPSMLIFTIIYLAVVIFYCLLDVKGMKTLKPNEWGDFLAGFFAPLVFMWIIYGYHQQGKELSFQIEELSNSVKQQQILASTAQKELNVIVDREKRQTELETINAQPYFHLNDLKISIYTYSESKQLSFEFNLKNSRNLCRSLFLMYSKNYEDNNLVWQGIDFLPHDLDKGISVNIRIPFSKIIDEGVDESVIFFKFFYTDAFDELRVQIIKISIDNKSLSSFLLTYTHIWLRNKDFLDNINYY